MKEADNFGNPNRDALHSAFRRKDSIRLDAKKLAKINPDYDHGPKRHMSVEEYNAAKEREAGKQK
jgi:hypothetical protein